jgi:rubrerythrin
MHQLKCVLTPVTDGGRGTGETNLGDQYLTKRYEVADVRFNSGMGAVLCDICGVIIKTGFDHEDKQHVCPSCALDELARLTQEMGLE